MIRCEECGTENLDGMLYCEDCGGELPEASLSDLGNEQDELEDIVPLGGPVLKLILAETGEEIQLPGKDVVIIGREDPVSAIFPDVDTTTFGGEDDGVSRKHAKIIRDGESYFVEDLHSVNSTFLNKTKLEADLPNPISDGDELMLGRLKFKIAIG